MELVTLYQGTETAKLQFQCMHCNIRLPINTTKNTTRGNPLSMYWCDDTISLKSIEELHKVA